jgi:predicted transcriptional regulator
MTPASQIIERLGGFQTVADMLGLSRDAVQRWTYSENPSGQKGDKVKGLGDRVPMRHWAALVAKSDGKVGLDELMDPAFAEVATSKSKRRRAA